MYLPAFFILSTLTGFFVSSLVALYLLPNIIAPGVYLEIELLDINDARADMRTLELRDALNAREKIIGGGGTLTCVIARAVYPGAPDLVELGRGCYRGIPVVRVPYQHLKPVVEEWIRLQNARCSFCKIDDFVFGMITTIIIIDVDSKKPIYMAHDSIPLRLGDLKTPRTIHYKAVLFRDSEHIIALKQAYRPLSYTKIETLELITPDEEEPLELTAPYIRITPIARIDPETLRNQRLLPEDYFREVNVGGRRITYLKTPVLIIENTHSYSGVIIGSISITSEYRVGFSLTWASGSILDSIMKGVIPSVDINIGGYTLGPDKRAFSSIFIVHPNESKWAYIWARPVIEIKKWEFCEAYWCYIEREIIEAFVSDVLVEGLTILGDVETGRPNEKIMSNLFNGTTSRRLYISGTSLGDGDLDVGESIDFYTVFSSYDPECGKLEVTAPVGAILGLAACTLLGLEIGGKACLAVISILSTLTINIEGEGRLYVHGVIRNFGKLYDVGYDVHEFIYVRESILKYRVPRPWWCLWCRSCSFNPPIGVYIESR